MTNGSVHAFPHMQIEDGKVTLQGGLSKREYFAAMAMQGFMSKEDAGSTDDWWNKRPEVIAQKSVEIANALLDELERTK